MSKCQAKVGFLLLRPCGKTVEQNCQFCGKMLCAEHALDVEEGGFACADCLKQRRPQAQQTDTRTHYFGTSYVPYYWNDWDESDRSVFAQDRDFRETSTPSTYDS